MKRAPEIIQIGDWRLKEGEYGKSVYNLTHSRIPETLAKISGMETADDYCAERDAEGRGIQKFIPYEEMDTVLQDGDILVYMDTNELLQIEKAAKPKQRGWHGEIAYKNEDGAFHQKATWSGKLRELKCADNGKERDAIIGILIRP